MLRGKINMISMKKAEIGMKELIYIALGLSVVLILIFIFANKYGFAEKVGVECEKNGGSCVPREDCATSMHLPFPCSVGTKDICCPRESLFSVGGQGD